ncbi:MAG TPA: hypothetical protein VJ302_21240 [Blastocatellia bacterium]|nr:hypothetical protein [Blastocatellia bacterium]
MANQLAEQMAKRLSRQLPTDLSSLSMVPKDSVTPSSAGASTQGQAPASTQQPSGQTPPQPDEEQGVKPKLKLPDDKPLGAVPKSRDARDTIPEDADFLEVKDRWRLGVPEDPRFRKGNVFNPYRQNVLKGDYPIMGNDIFMNVQFTIESTANINTVPTSQALSSRNSGGFEFFGRGRTDKVNSYLFASVEMFKGAASFKPVDWRMKVSVASNINYLGARENGITNISFREGIQRQKNFTAINEVFFEYRMGDTPKFFPFLRGAGSKGGQSPEYDTTSIRVGMQEFNADFRGFLFKDTNLGARMFGNFHNNRYQYNLMHFNMLEKETNSELNIFQPSRTNFRDQQVYIANVYRQDTFVLGYTMQGLLAYSNDNGRGGDDNFGPTGFELDSNNVPIRPLISGQGSRTHKVRSGYIGVNGDGHFGRYNITHSFYQAIGTDAFNSLGFNRAVNRTGRQRINAQMAAAEFSIDFDYLRYRIAGFYTSGDSNPYDGTARGFDTILDHPNFAGGKFSFWNSQGIKLSGAPTISFVEPFSFIPSLRTSKIEGQQNFINPGLTLYNTGIDADLTPKLRGFINYNYIRMNETNVLKILLNQTNIRREIGHDLGVGFIYRPLLSENIIFTGGTSTLRPGRGFTDIFKSNCSGTPQGCGSNSPTLFATFLTMKLTY